MSRSQFLSQGFEFKPLISSGKCHTWDSGVTISVSLSVPRSEKVWEPLMWVNKHSIALFRSTNLFDALIFSLGLVRHNVNMLHFRLFPMISIAIFFPPSNHQMKK